MEPIDRLHQVQTTMLEHELVMMRQRAEAAEAELTAMKLERNYWEARCHRAESEAFTADAEADILRIELSRLQP